MTAEQAPDETPSFRAGLEILNAGLREAQRIERQYRLIVDRLRAEDERKRREGEAPK